MVEEMTFKFIFLGKNHLCQKHYPEETTVWGTKGLYAVSFSTASLWAFWNTFKMAWKSLASLASAIFLLVWKHKKKDKILNPN